ncbi:hypothetical protein [Streptomyces sp. NBC_01264]|uniref:hypothetical protein n=1 Tax=Streptomyces sp. NBC_01264 TaxID=2903804 RepID=UPI00224CFD1D|nr:hypothetical protein [Streptomyces sp. NBC_01264]MCX4776511.1 hypothetical protein [Streptomyces sp. NBC_01264]
MRPKSQHYCILVVDIEKFGKRRNPVQVRLRSALYALVDSAFREAGIDHESGPPPVDRGDGFFWLLPADVDKTDLTGRFVELLHHRLREHAALSSDEGAMRLRVALHDGDVAEDGHGWVGEELNTACRLADIAPLRTALAEGVRSGLALAVSDEWYRRVVRHDDPSVVRESFRRVAFDAKEIQGARAWVRVPGYSVPPGIDGEPPVTGDDSAPPGAAPGSGAGGPAAGGPFAGAVFERVGQVFGGDQHVHGPQAFSFADLQSDPAGGEFTGGRGSGGSGGPHGPGPDGRGE